MKTIPIDERRKLVIPGDEKATYDYAAKAICDMANKAIAEKGSFTIALFGGSTPIPLYQKLSSEYRDTLDWSKVRLFFSDERAHPPHHKESNYHIAFEEGGLKSLPLKEENIFRMKAEETISENALAYEALIRERVKDSRFDLVLLGLGEDGHTASLFPDNQALFVINRLVIAANDEKRGWRMTFTFQLINQSKNIFVIVTGKHKEAILHRLFTSEYNPDKLPAERIGSITSPATFIADEEASTFLLSSLK